MCFNFIISIAARCSDVCGCGHGSFAAMSRSAASMTAAPLSMVAMRMSCPGQSTNETCLQESSPCVNSQPSRAQPRLQTHLSSFIVPPQPGTRHAGESSLSEL